MELAEWTVTPEARTVAAGMVALGAVNTGQEPHELVVIRGALDDLPTDADGAVLEDEVEVVGEIGSFPAGERCTAAFDLQPGTYALICNLVETEGGAVEAHFAEGMAAELDVT